MLDHTQYRWRAPFNNHQVKLLEAFQQLAGPRAYSCRQCFYPLAVSQIGLYCSNEECSHPDFREEVEEIIEDIDHAEASS